MRLMPFTAILGQDDVKYALLLNAIDPKIGGVLIRGEKGTGKSTIARGIAPLLPSIEVVRGCRYGCSPHFSTGNLCNECKDRLKKGETLDSVQKPAPFVNFPLNATEEMITGTMNLKKAITAGKRAFQPGILADANRGFLYIDEVNLLHDHLVDIILDCAATGINTVEREGIQIKHPAQFTTLGSMNPEEGDLRAQLLDRFGFCVDIRSLPDLETRVEVMERREQFDTDPLHFTKLYTENERQMQLNIIEAKELLPSVIISGKLLGFISHLCIENRVKGHRADIIISRGAKAYAALNGRREVLRTDIQFVARYVLLHRSNVRDHKEECPEHEKEILGKQNEGENTETIVTEAIKTGELSGTGEEEENFPSLRNADTEPSGDKEKIIVGREEVFEIGNVFPVKKLPVFTTRKKMRGNGKRSSAKTPLREGRYVRSRPARDLHDIAFDATLRAAAPHQLRRKEASPLACIIRLEDVHEKVREKKIGNLFLFILDASGSMGAHQRMVATKGAIFSLLMDAYQKRDKAAMVTFQKRTAKCILPPTSSIDLAGKLLKDLPVGGRTPLSLGLLTGYSVLHNYLIKEPDANPIVVVITDGKANIPLHGNDPFAEALSIAAMMARQSKTKYIVVDTLEPRLANLGTAKKLAEALGADYFKIEDLQTSDLVQIARSTD